MKKTSVKKKPIRVLVAMSGGVDSSVAALLMKKKGYEVIGAFMKNWSNTKNALGECKWREERRMAIKIASILDIPLITFDFEKLYKKQIIEKMFENYRKGITPNPDIDCNQKIKFPLLINAAKKLHADFLVTGHYARIKKVLNRKITRINKDNIKNKVLLVKHKNTSAGVNEQQLKNNVWTGGGKVQLELLRAKDESKDQSYFLYRLKQSELKHSLFPIGQFTKQQIREIAKKHKFPNWNKKSTVGICFVGKINLKKFLQKKIKAKKGKILNPEGKIIGEHDGIYYYTIGQRLGPRYGIYIAKTDIDKRKIKRWYVAKKDVKKNIIIAAPENHSLLYRKEIIIKNSHWMNKQEINSLFPVGWRAGDGNGKSIKVHARIRQVGELIPSKLFYNKNKKHFQVILNKAITGISEGQAIVLYQGKKVLGGGVISFSF